MLMKDVMNTRGRLATQLNTMYSVNCRPVSKIAVSHQSYKQSLDTVSISYQ